MVVSETHVSYGVGGAGNMRESHRPPYPHPSLPETPQAVPLLKKPPRPS